MQASQNGGEGSLRFMSPDACPACTSGEALRPQGRLRGFLPTSRSGQLPDRKSVLVKPAVTRDPFSQRPSPGFSSALSLGSRLGKGISGGLLDPQPGGRGSPHLVFSCVHGGSPLLDVPLGELSGTGSACGHHPDLALSPAFTSNHLCDFGRWTFLSVGLGFPICKMGPRMHALRVYSFLLAALTNDHRR